MTNIKVHPCSKEHTNDVIDLLAAAFSCEPTSTTCRTTNETTTLEDWKEFVTFFAESSCENGYSVIAINEDNKDVAGVFILRDFHLPLPDEFESFIAARPGLTNTIQALDEIDQAFFDKHPEYKSKPIGKVMDFWMVGVNEKYTGQGLSKLMTDKAKELLQGSEYEYAVMECSGFFSQSMAFKCGFTPVVERDYVSFLKDGKPIFNPSGVHTKWIFFELKLK